MSEAGADSHRDDVLGVSARTLIIGLVAARVAVVIILIARADGVQDEGILRYDRVAASPVTPYRNFSVEWMPLQTAVVQIVGGDGGAATAARVAVAALVADAAVAAALAAGWSARTAARYLLLGLPLLGVAYARLDLIAVALATWAFALARRSRDGPAGLTLGLAALSGLWAAFLLPWALVRRRRPTLVGAAACLVTGGAAWFLIGGPKGPMQVVSYRGSTGWDVESTVGSLLVAFTDGATFTEAGVLRIGFASPAARSVILILLLVITAGAWRRWFVHGGDRAGRTILGITAAILALTPTFPPVWASFLVPWTAAAFDEDRGTTIAVSLALVLTGLLSAQVVNAGDTFHQAVVLGRQVILLGVAWVALAPRRRDREALV